MLKTGKHKTKTNYMFRSQENQSTNSASKNQIHLQRVYRDYSLCTSPRSSSKDMKWTQESLRSEKPQEKIREKRKTKKRRKLFNLNMRMLIDEKDQTDSTAIVNTRDNQENANDQSHKLLASQQSMHAEKKSITMRSHATHANEHLEVNHMW